MQYKIIPALGFDVLTPLYGFLCAWGGYGRPFKEKVLKAVGFKEGDDLLDVGCGTGTLLRIAKLRYPKSRVVGTDPDERILRIAKKNVMRERERELNPAVELIKAEAEKLPFPPATFTVVTSSLVFHHLPTKGKKQALKEIYRVLKPNGRFLLADFGPARNAKSRFHFFLAQWLRVEKPSALKDNIEGKMPIFLKEAGFSVSEALPPERSVEFLLARKI